MDDIRTVNVYNLCKTLLLVVYSLLEANISFWYPLKTSENLRLSYVVFLGWGVGWIVGLI